MTAASNAHFAITVWLNVITYLELTNVQHYSEHLREVTAEELTASTDVWAEDQIRLQSDPSVGWMDGWIDG